MNKGLGITNDQLDFVFLVPISLPVVDTEQTIWTQAGSNNKASIASVSLYPSAATSAVFSGPA